MKTKLILASILLLSGVVCAQTSNKIELSFAAAAISGDAYTTLHNHNDFNPIVNKFAMHPAGNAAYFGGSFALLAFGNHVLRNHPRYRHALNWSVIATETFMTFHNISYQRRYNSELRAANQCQALWRQQGILTGPCHF